MLDAFGYGHKRWSARSPIHFLKFNIFYSAEFRLCDLFQAMIGVLTAVQLNRLGLQSTSALRCASNVLEFTGFILCTSFIIMRIIMDIRFIFVLTAKFYAYILIERLILSLTYFTILG